MDLKTEFAVDEKKEVEGVWFTDEFGGEVSCKIARIGNKNYQKCFNRLSRPHRRALRRGILNDDLMETLLIKTMAETILLDWKDMKEGGKVLKYSKDEAFRVMQKYRDFRDIVSDIANEIEGYRAEEVESAEKN